MIWTMIEIRLPRVFCVSLSFMLLSGLVIAQPITPVDSLANSGEECRILIKVARECVGKRTDQIARILVDRSYEVNNISTSLGMQMAALLIGNKRYDIGLSYGHNAVCVREKHGDLDGPLHAIGCYWTAKPNRIRLYCHGDGYTMTPVWDTVLDAAESPTLNAWTPRIDSRFEDLPDSLYLWRGRSMRELMTLFDSLQVWVRTVQTKNDSIIRISISPQIKLTVTLADDHIGTLESKVPHVYDMLDDRRIRSIKFYRWPPKDAREYKEPVREIIYPEVITTGDSDKE